MKGHLTRIPLYYLLSIARVQFRYWLPAVINLPRGLNLLFGSQMNTSDTDAAVVWKFIGLVAPQRQRFATIIIRFFTRIT
jgi:hypothetical protein